MQPEEDTQKQAISKPTNQNAQNKPSAEVLGVELRKDPSKDDKAKTLPVQGQPRERVDVQRSKSEIVTRKVSQFPEQVALPGPSTSTSASASAAYQPENIGQVEQTVYEDPEGRGADVNLYQTKVRNCFI